LPSRDIIGLAAEWQIRRAPILPRSNPILVIQKQHARLRTRAGAKAGTALGIIFATMMLTTLSLLLFLRWSIKSQNQQLGACAVVGSG
jgi:hypothetical protein